MKKALVVGSEGNVGKKLVKYLREVGYEVKTTDIKARWREDYINADITKPIDLVKCFNWRPDYVFHLAAMVSRVTCEQSPSMAVDTNLVGTQNIIELTKMCGAKLINFSTSEVYGPNVEYMSEENEPNPNNRYGLTKLLAEKLIEYEVKENNFNAITLRPFMIYDEEEGFGDNRSAMIRFAHDLVKGKNIYVHESSARGWLHISDAVKAIEAATRVDNYEIINIGNPQIMDTIDLAKLICKAVGAKEELINTIKLPERMTLSKNPSLEKQSKLLNIIPSVTIEEGVKLVCKKVQDRILCE